jgi:ACS family sodium-dependent inorganic phosphate cotransporter-like MFS transporter 9
MVSSVSRSDAGRITVSGTKQMKKTEKKSEEIVRAKRTGGGKEAVFLSRSSSKERRRRKIVVAAAFAVGASSSSSLGEGEEEEEEEKKKNDIGIEFESISYDENFVGLTKPIAFALFKHKTQAVITLGLVLLFSTADRTIFTLTALPIAKELQLSIAQIGWIQNVFLIGYMSTNVIGGQLATSKKSGSISPANLLFLALFFWSLAVALLPALLWLKSSGAAFLFGLEKMLTPFVILLISRLLFGLASGVALPAAAGFCGTSAYFLDAERGETFTTLLSMFNVGSGFGMLFGGFLVPAIGWKGAFFAFGLGGMVYAIVAHIRLRRLDRFIDKVEERHNNPAFVDGGDIPMLSEDECAALDSSFTETKTKEEEEEEEGTFASEERARQVFDASCEDYSNRTWLMNSSLSVKLQLLVVTLTHIMTNIGFFTFQNWLGIYMQGSLGFSVSDTGAYLFLPWFMTALVAYFGGKLCQKAIRDYQTPPWKTRRIAMTVATMIPALGCLLLAYFSLAVSATPLFIAENIQVLSVSIVALVVGAQAASVAGVHAYLQDYAAERAGSILGVTNTAGVFSCLLANKLIAGWVGESASAGFAKVFFGLAFMYVFCGLVWIRSMKGDRLDGKKAAIS